MQPTQAPRCQLSGCSLTVHVDGRTGRVHNFCGRRHADLAAAGGGSPSPSGGGGGGAAVAVAVTVPTKGKAECRLEGCRELVYRDPVTTVVSGPLSDRCVRWKVSIVSIVSTVSHDFRLCLVLALLVLGRRAADPTHLC